MTDITLGDTQSYLLPLDSLDLTYLSKYVRSSNNKLSPIWSQQRLNGESEYFHVKIAAQSSDAEDCYLESLDTYTCHICDINVPKICYKQHNESKQHETCKKISEKVLERVAKQININNIDNDWNDTNNLYYCAPCSRAVNLKNKHKHESSNYHKKSEENMSIINDFYNKILENGTRMIDSPRHSHEKSDSDSDESEIQDSYLKEIHTERDKRDIIDDRNIVTKAEYCEICKVEVSQSGRKVHSFTECFKDVIIKAVCDVVKHTSKAFNVELKKDFLKDGAYHKDVITKAVCDVVRNGFKVFNVELKKGFQKNGKYQKDIITKAVCDVVNDGFKPFNVELKNALQNITLTLTSNIPSTSTSNSNNITNGNERQMHIDGYYKLLVNTDNTRPKFKCKICNVQVPYHENNIIRHMEGYNHKQVFQNYLKLMKWSDDTKTALKCEICDVNVPNFQWNVYEHITAKLHEENVDELLKYHAILKDRNIYKCCCCEISVTDYFGHINSDNHTNQFQEEYNIDKKVLRKYVYEDTNSTQSIEAIFYRELYKNLLRSNNISKLNNSRFYCGICRIELTRKSEVDHVLGERHLSVKQDESESSSEEEEDSSYS